MLRLHFLVPLLGLSSVLVLACGTGDKDSAGEGGAGGEATTPMGGGGEGQGGAGGADCVTGGNGKLVIEVSGLPTGVAPEVLIEGPDDLSVDEAELTLEGVASGDYTVTAARVFDTDPIVRTVFDATVTAPAFCLGDGAEHTVKVTYQAIPSSNKLWMPTALDDEGAGFSSDLLSASGLADASVSIDAGIGKAIAFDRDGNMWTLGPTADFQHVLRFPAAALGESGAPAPDIAFDVPEVGCLPAMKTLALDLSGNLWLSTCDSSLLRIPAAELSGVGVEKTADVLIAGMDDNQGMAFDDEGNLWVGTAVGVARYDAERLGESTGDAPDLLLSVKDDTGDLRAWFLAFDKEGDLWATDVIGNVAFEIARTDLTGTGEATVDATVSITLDVLALTDQAAFDDGGGLWVGLALDADLGAGGIGRLSPEQLTVSTLSGESAVPETVLNSASVGSGLPVAFFPAPAGLPLYHSIPVE